MRTRLFAILVLVAVGVLGAIGAAGATRASEASHGGQPLHATLSPENQVPPTASNGSGTALVTLNQGQSEVCFDITVSNLTSPVILAHIHQGAAGTNGPIVVDFMEPVNGLNGCVHADAALIKEIRHDRAGFYVNVHTTMFPGGEVRGQLG
jgi:CHRD domain-containing protein